MVGVKVSLPSNDSLEDLQLLDYANERLSRMNVARTEPLFAVAYYIASSLY